MGCRNIGMAVALAVAAVVACSESTPPPEPRRSPSPRIPSCVTDADCSAGEECRDGVCWRPGLDEVDGTPRAACPEGCPPNEVCADGICVGQITGDGGTLDDDACGGCPEGWTCDAIRGECRAPGDGPTGEGRPDDREPPR